MAAIKIVPFSYNSVFVMYRILRNFCVVLFFQISQILLSRKIKFRKSITMPHLICCPHGSFVKIYFTKLLKSQFSRKFSDIKIFQYTVWCPCKTNLCLATGMKKQRQKKAKYGTQIS